MPCPNLDAIRTLRAGITAPPWDMQPKDGPREVTLKRRHWEIGQVVHGDKGVALVFGDNDANAVFIAAAPTIIDELLAYVEELEGKENL